jgi:hypothetical protein
VILFESEAGTGFDLERITNERKRGDSRTAPAAVAENTAERIFSAFSRGHSAIAERFRRIPAFPAERILRFLFA